MIEMPEEELRRLARAVREAATALEQDGRLGTFQLAGELREAHDQIADYFQAWARGRERRAREDAARGTHTLGPELVELFVEEGAL